MHGILSISPLKASFSLVITFLLTYSDFLTQWRYSWRGPLLPSLQRGQGPGCCPTVPPANFSSPKGTFPLATVLAGLMLAVLAQTQRKVSSTCLISLCYFASGVSLYNLLMLPFLGVENQRHFRLLELFPSSPFITCY